MLSFFVLYLATAANADTGASPAFTPFTGVVSPTCPPPLIQPGTPNAVVIDIRPPSQFNAGHLSCAQNVWFSASDFLETMTFMVPDPNAELLMYCQTGGAVNLAEQQLRALGWNNIQNLGAYKDLYANGCEYCGLGQCTATKRGSSAVVVDVRTQQEWDAGHLSCAVQFDFYDPNFYSMVTAAYPNQSQELLLYCRSGNRASIAAAQFVQMGWTNVVSIGGYQDLLNLGCEHCGGPMPLPLATLTCGDINSYSGVLKPMKTNHCNRASGCTLKGKGGKCKAIKQKKTKCKQYKTRTDCLAAGCTPKGKPNRFKKCKN